MNKKYFIILIVALVLEVIVFNITSYCNLFGKYAKRTYNSDGLAKKQSNLENNYNGNLQLKYYGEDEERIFIQVPKINEKTVSVKLELKDIEDVVEYQVYFEDETSTEYQSLVSKKYIPSYEKSKYMPLYLSGKTESLIIVLNKDLYENVDKVIINENIPFEFNFIRFTLVFGILTFIYSLKNAKIFNKEYSVKDLNQEIILISIIAVLFALLAWINNFSTNVTEENFYSNDFVEALSKGQFHLLKEPTEKFLNLENKYDAFARGSTGIQRDVDYMWDTAYYNGKQYVYFGILPALISFLPFFLITKKYLEIPIVVFIFSMLIFVLFKEILLKILNMFFEKIPFKFVVYFLIIICSGSSILYANGMARVYELVIVAAVYFSLQGIFFILKSFENEKNKYLNIFWGSLFLSLSVACRPTALLVSLIIVPYLIYLLIENIKQLKTNKKPLIKLTISVGIPYITVGIALMIYNYIRFGNIFEFGAKYQITINNMLALSNRLATIPMGIITNFFSIPNFIPDFPFITNHNKLINFYGYYYIENMIGGLFIIAPICFLNFFIIKINKKIENKKLKIIINSLTIIGLLLAIVSIAMAGSSQRYLIDYSWMLILSGILIFMWLYSYFKSEEAKKILNYFLAIITIYMFLVGLSSGILSEKSYMERHSPEEYYKTKYMICFWE